VRRGEAEDVAPESSAERGVARIVEKRAAEHLVRLAGLIQREHGSDSSLQFAPIEQRIRFLQSLRGHFHKKEKLRTPGGEFGSAGAPETTETRMLPGLIRRVRGPSAASAQQTLWRPAAGS
jgi:hypothetical protein